MARLPRSCPAGFPQHVIQRGNNRSSSFADEQGFSAYANWLKDYSIKFEVAVHAWVFMTNHAHLLATPTTSNGLSVMMQALGRRYVRYFNHQYKRTGTLWEGRFKSCLVQSEIYLLQCYRYIELNPVRAGMVDDPSGYPWSSYRQNGLGIDTALCTHHDVYLRPGDDPAARAKVYRALFKAHIEGELLSEIRDAANKGLALGSEYFKDQAAALYERRLRPARMGRPKKSLI